jgi:hypothetical protein
MAKVNQGANAAKSAPKNTNIPKPTSSAFEMPMWTKKWYVPYIALFVIFYITAAIYFLPTLQGKEFYSHDSSQWTAMSKESMDYYKEKGEYAQWSGRMFGGMPGVMLWGIKYPDLVDYTGIAALNGIHVFPSLFMYEFFMLGFMASLLLFLYYRRFLPSLFAGFAIQLSTVSAVSLAAGHVNKIGTLAFFVPILFSALLILKRKYIIGFIMFMICLHSMMLENHTQIVYYIILFVVPFVLLKAIVDFIKDKDFMHLVKSGVLMIITCVITLMMHSTILVQNDFLKETTRGTQILNFDSQNTNGNEPAAGEDGVGMDYATQWSYGLKEIGSWIIPNFNGGASGGSVDENSNTYNALVSNGVAPEQAIGFCSRLPLYWGDQPFVAGPYYLGVLVVFLFFLGMFLNKGKIKWYLLALILFSTGMALGKNFKFFFQLLYDYVPLFNKFRAPTMIIGVVQICMAIVGMHAIINLISEKYSLEEKTKALKWSGGIVAGLCLFFWLLGSSFLPFESKYKETPTTPTADESFKQQLVQMAGNEEFATTIISAVKKDRASLMSKDAMRSSIFVILAIGLIYLMLYRKFNATMVFCGLTILTILDLWQINKRYLNDSLFVDKGTVEQTTYPLTAANLKIQEDKSYNRMIDFTVSPFNDAGPCLYHFTIGGYNPNKLRRYQDIIENGLNKDIAKLNQGRFDAMHYFNMLNCKYIKTAPEAEKLITNPYALGPCWFVNRLKIVNTPEEEITLVDSLNPKDIAIIHKEFEADISDMMLGADTSNNESRYIRFVSYDPKYMVYESNSSKDEFAVFSEVIYRPNVEWKAYIDGKEAKHIRVDYILRGMRIPQGKHKIEFKYNNVLFEKTYKVAYAGCFLFLATIALAIGVYFRQKRKVID